MTFSRPGSTGSNYQGTINNDDNIKNNNANYDKAVCEDFGNWSTI